MRLSLPLLAALTLIVACSPIGPEGISEIESHPLHRRVDPFIGTGGHGHTYPGATAPFGMVQLSPDTRLEGWDGCGGYHYTDSVIFGFSHTHLQGTGVSDYGDILFAPTNSQTKTGNNWGERYSSVFQKENETAHAGYYAVTLDDHNMRVQLTTTPRVGIHHYALENPEDSLTLFIDMAHRDELVEYSLFPQGDSLVVGHRISNNWAQEQHVYFVAQFSEPFDWLDQTYEVIEQTFNEETGQEEQTVEYVPVFPLVFQKDARQLTVKVGLSFTSTQAAYENLLAEAPHWDFQQYKRQAEAAWDAQLGKVEVSGGTAEQQRNFYSALYHSNTVPNLASDVSGTYRGTDLQIHEGEGTDHYTVFSLWDTFRATHPQFTLTEPERTHDFIQTFLRMYQQGGQLPIWELSSNYTGCMIGYHSVPVIVDAYFKGIDQFDHKLALEAMVQIADSAHLGKPAFAKQGFIPSEVEHESVSKGLEYAYNDWCIARFAEALGAQDTAERFYRRASHYRNIINTESGFAQPRRNGGWAGNFDPYEVNFNFTEANSYQYSFFVPHDIEGHIAHVGGPDRYEGLLDSLFVADKSTTGRNQPDITGLIGQYAHGNEPSHHMAWLYHYLGKPHKSTAMVHRILNELYTDQPDGLCGNEDCGQMSSWYVLSSLGLYPVNPASPEYVLGAPLFPSAQIQVGSDTLLITADHPGKPYVQRATLNGEELQRSWVNHRDLASGGVLAFELGDAPNDAWGASQKPSSRLEVAYVPAPVINMDRVYQDSVLVSVTCPDPNAEIRLRASVFEFAPKFGTWDLGSPIVNSQAEGTTGFTSYKGPFWLTGERATVEAYACHDTMATSGIESAKVYAEGYHHSPSFDLELLSLYDNQYTAGGAGALNDGLKGSDDFRTGEWQGYWGTNVEMVLDLNESRPVQFVELGVLQDVKPWIFYPEKVEVFTSTDGENWTSFGWHDIAVPKDDYTVQHMDVRVDALMSYGGAANARYVKVVAHGMDVIPEWHLGAGGKPWIFVDEVRVYPEP